MDDLNACHHSRVVLVQSHLNVSQEERTLELEPANHQEAMRLFSRDMSLKCNVGLFLQGGPVCGFRRNQEESLRLQVQTKRYWPSFNIRTTQRVGSRES